MKFEILLWQLNTKIQINYCIIGNYFVKKQ